MDGEWMEGWMMEGWMMDGWLDDGWMMSQLWNNVGRASLFEANEWFKVCGTVKVQRMGGWTNTSWNEVIVIRAQAARSLQERAAWALHPKAHLRASGWNLKKKTWVSKYCDLQMFRQPVVSLCAQRSTYSCVWLSAAQMFVFAAAAQRHAGKGWRKIWWKCPD